MSTGFFVGRVVGFDGLDVLAGFDGAEDDGVELGRADTLPLGDVLDAGDEPAGPAAGEPLDELPPAPGFGALPPRAARATATTATMTTTAATAHQTHGRRAGVGVLESAVAMRCSTLQDVAPGARPASA
jgi:hypothetical protein